MNLSNWSDTDRAALRSFYETGHQWSWDDLENGTTTAARAAREWIESSPPPRDHPLLLPRVLGTDANMRAYWYAIAFSEAQAEELREHLNAFISSAGTDFSGRRTVLDITDIAEATLVTWAGGPWIFRFGVLPEKRSLVRSALQRLQQVWRLRPPPSVNNFRTTEALLAAFFSAIVNQDEPGVVRWLNEIRACGRLSAENLVFLEIERLAAFGHWHALATLPQIELLSKMRRPRHITALLIEALWRTELSDYLVRFDTIGITSYFRSNFYPRYQSLLRGRTSLTSAPVTLTFLLAAVTAEPPRREQLPVLLKILATTPYQSFAESIAALVPKLIPETPPKPMLSNLEQALAAFQRDDYDSALLLLRQTPDGPEKCSLLMDCAAESQFIDDARAACDCLDALSIQDRDRILASKRRRRILEDLKSILAPSDATTPVDWEGWLDHLDRQVGSSQLLSIARMAMIDWPVTSYLNDPQRIRLLGERLIVDRDEKSQDVMHLAFPYILGYFLRDGRGAPPFLPLYRDLLLLLVVSERFTSEDLPTCQTLLLAILEAGADARVYGETVNMLTEVWVKFGSPAGLDWAFDTLDLLVANPAPVLESRFAFFDSVRDRLWKDYRRIRPEHWETFRWLASDLDRMVDYEALQPKIDIATANNENIQDIFTGRIVAIYTLTESAGTRAKELLEHLFPGLDVRLNHDHGGTERLKLLARESDYFVVATRSATHAATEFLKSQRPKGKSPLLYPLGKGSSSIVTALTTALQLESAR